jgi:hypothetical protein
MPCRYRCGCRRSRWGCGSSVPVPLIYLEEERSFGGRLDSACYRLNHYREVLGATQHGLQRRRCGVVAPQGVGQRGWRMEDRGWRGLGKNKPRTVFRGYVNSDLEFSLLVISLRHSPRMPETVPSDQACPPGASLEQHARPCARRGQGL